MSRSHTRQMHLAKKRKNKRSKGRGWKSVKQAQVGVAGTLYDAMRKEAAELSRLHAKWARTDG